MTKRIIALVLALLCLALTVVSCGDKTDDENDPNKPIGIMPTYIGESVTSTYHEFAKEDFNVLVAYADGTDETVTDYDFEVLEMSNGYFIIEFTYRGVSNKCYVPCNVAVYPSDAQ